MSNATIEPTTETPPTAEELAQATFYLEQTTKACTNSPQSFKPWTANTWREHLAALKAGTLPASMVKVYADNHRKIVDKPRRKEQEADLWRQVAEIRAAKEAEQRAQRRCDERSRAAATPPPAPPAQAKRHAVQTYSVGRWQREAQEQFPDDREARAKYVKGKVDEAMR